MGNPKGPKGMKRKLQRVRKETASAVKFAMVEASKAIDQQGQEIIALRRIIISERAQLIFYCEKYQQAIAGQLFDLEAVDFLKMPEEQQEIFVKRAVRELNDGEITAHEPQQTVSPAAKRLIV